MGKEVIYNVRCLNCGHIWQPAFKSRFWWKAKQHAEKGYLDALNVSAKDCGCEEEVLGPDAPYRVVGYDDMCSDFDVPFLSLTRAAKLYLKLARDFSNTVIFVDTREVNGQRSRVHQRLEELARI